MSSNREFTCRKCKQTLPINKYGLDVHLLCEDCTTQFQLWLGE